MGNSFQKRIDFKSYREVPDDLLRQLLSEEKDISKCKEIIQELEYRSLNNLSMIRETLFGETVIETWSTNGKPFRKDGPAVIIRLKGAIEAVKWHIEESCPGFNRPEEDGPTLFLYYPSGKLEEVHYISVDGHHNQKDGGAAIVRYDEEGRKVEETFYENFKAVKEVKHLY